MISAVSSLLGVLFKKISYRYKSLLSAPSGPGLMISCSLAQSVYQYPSGITVGEKGVRVRVETNMTSAVSFRMTAMLVSYLFQPSCSKPLTLSPMVL